MEIVLIIQIPVNAMLDGLVTCVMCLNAMVDLVVNMELVFNILPVEKTFVFASLVGKEIHVTDAFLTGNVHNPTFLTVSQPVSIQMTVSVQQPAYLIQKDFVVMKN